MGMSLETAEWISEWGNWILIGSLVAGVLATYAIIASGNVKERALKRELASTNAEAAKASESALKSQERIAELNNETAKLKLQLAPRRIDGAAFTTVLAGRPKAKVELLYVRDDPDSYQLSLQIFWYLMHAGWDCEVEKPIPEPSADSPYQGKPIPLSVLARETGISLVVGDRSNMKPDSDTPYAALLKAFQATPGQVESGADPRVPLDTVRVVVAPKPLTEHVGPPDILPIRGVGYSSHRRAPRWPLQPLATSRGRKSWPPPAA